MSRRHANKRAARARKEWRGDLVHAAGCVYPDCIVRTYLRDPEHGMLPAAHYHPLRPVRVPRSLRWIHGERLMPVLGRKVA